MDSGKRYGSCTICGKTMSAHINVSKPIDHAFGHPANTEEVPDHTPDPRVRTCPRCKDTDFDSATDLIEHVRECYRASWQVQYRTEDPMESPSEGVLMDYRHEIHDYLVEKGEREE